MSDRRSVAGKTVAGATAMWRDSTAVALETPGGILSYAELHARASGLAGALASVGVTSGDVVAVCLPRGHEQIIALLATWYAGAAYLPLDPVWPSKRIEALIARADCVALIARQPLAVSVPVIMPETSAPFVGPVPVLNDDLAYVIYTSGSSSEPKGVEVTHGNVAALAVWHREAFDLRQGTRTSHLAGLAFDAAAWELWPTLAAGGTVVSVDDATRMEPAKLRDWLVAHRIEVAFAPTALAEPMVRLEWPASARLRVLLTGADKLTVRPRTDLPFTFVNNYGPTECTVVATSGVVAPHGEGLPSIGCAIAGTRVHLLDPDGGPVPNGAPGEIYIGGLQVARGYRADPALTNARFINHPHFGRVYRTGDLALALPAGELAFLGRMDSQIKVRGHRIEPAEVMAALHRVPEVTASWVLVRDGALVAYIVPAPGTAPTAGALRKALAILLPDYMIPQQFAALDALPLTPNGKVDVKALPEPSEHMLCEAAGRAPETPTERRLHAIVCDVIGRDDFGVDDDFFLLGGHSLLGTQVVVRGRDAFGVDLTLFHLFEDRSVAALAATVEGLVMEKLDTLSDEDILRLSAA